MTKGTIPKKQEENHLFFFLISLHILKLQVKTET